MADLIGRVRTLIGDPGGPDAVMDDERIQEALDAHRTDVRYLELQGEETRSAGAYTYHDYYAPVGGWESDEALLDGGYAVLTPSVADRLTGHWAFIENMPPPVLIIGKTFDLHAAAADLLEAWAAQAKLDFDFQADGASYRRSQRPAQLLALAAKYRARQRPLPSAAGEERHMDLIVVGIPIASAILGITQLAKKLGVSDRAAAPVAVALGVLFGVLAKLSEDPAVAAWVEPILLGLLTGLAAAGLYSGAKAQTEPNTPAKT